MCEDIEVVHAETAVTAEHPEARWFFNREILVLLRSTGPQRETKDLHAPPT